MAVIEISVCYYLRQKSSGTVKSFSIRCSKFPNMNVSRKEMRRVGKTPENYRGRKYTKEKKKCLKYECIVVKLLVMQCLTLFACNINGCFSERKNECICTVKWAFTLLEKKLSKNISIFRKKNREVRKFKNWKFISMNGFWEWKNFWKLPEVVVLTEYWQLRN